MLGWGNGKTGEKAHYSSSPVYKRYVAKQTWL